ncbi:hypothetical protein [Bradyrhizobium elkanii]
MTDPDDQTGKPVLCARLNGDTLRAKWPGKRWHGKYKNIDEVCDAAHDDGLASFVIDYVTKED